MNEEIFGTPDHQPEGEGTAPNPSEEGPFLEKNNPAVSPLLENETASIPEQQPSVPNIPQTELPHTEPFAQHLSLIHISLWWRFPPLGKNINRILFI